MQTTDSERAHQATTTDGTIAMKALVYHEGRAHDPTLKAAKGVTMPTHAVVWIDHKEARIFHVHPEATDETTVLAPQHHVHRHPKGRGEPREHPDDAHRFFAEVVPMLDGADAILITGPSLAKLELSRYMKEHAAGLAAKVVGIESADHPTDAQVVAEARRHFLATDRLR